MASIQKRTSQEGEVSYRVQVRLKGHPTETASFKRLTDARAWAQNTESAIREGRHFKTSVSKKHTMAEAIDKYTKENLAHRKNPVNQKTYLAYWRDMLGDYTMADITSALIVKHRNELVGKENKYGRKIGTATANRYTQALGHVLTIAVKEWEDPHNGGGIQRCNSQSANGSELVDTMASGQYRDTYRLSIRYMGIGY